MKLANVLRKLMVGNCVNSFDDDGNCINPYLPWDHVNDFACAVEEGDNITIGNIKIEYDEDTDIHTFYKIS